MMPKGGRKRDPNCELRYWEVLSQGIGRIEACRLVSVSRNTGYRWRAQMGDVLTKKPATSSSRYLSPFELQRIDSWHDCAARIREIARHVGRSPSTVSRELRCNARDWDEGYEPVMAQRRASERAKRPKVGKIESSRWLT
jgi:transposase